jgi:hypothetical protein
MNISTTSFLGGLPSMRVRARLAVTTLGVAALLLGGCDGGGMSEGIEEKVDMSKDYTPKVDMPGMSPKAAKAADKKSKEEAAKAPATPTPLPEN